MGNAASTARFPLTGTPGGALPGRFGHADNLVIRFEGPIERFAVSTGIRILLGADAVSS